MGPGVLLAVRPPQVPWLEPDINDHLEELARKGGPAVVLVPIGFVSDHMEVVYDLDTEAAATADRLGPASAGPQPQASTRASSRGPRPARRAGRGRAGREGPPSGGRQPPGEVGRLCGRMLPQPACRAAGPGR